MVERGDEASHVGYARPEDAVRLNAEHREFRWLTTRQSAWFVSAVGDDASSGRVHDRAGRRHRAGRSRWISSRPVFLLPVRVLGKLFRRLFLNRLIALHDAGRLAFVGTMAHLADRWAFLRHLAPVLKRRWVVYAKAPFVGPEAVLAYLSRYTDRVAISNRRLSPSTRTASPSATGLPP
jgi:hypothetical protein